MSIDTRNDECVLLVRRLLEELTTEIELHYEITEYTNMTPTMESIRVSVDFLKRHGADVPKVALKVLDDRARQMH